MRSRPLATPSDVASYCWSNYPEYRLAIKMLDWVTYDRVLADFSPGDTAARRRRHRRNVMAELNQSMKSPSANGVHGLIVGSQKFASRIQRLLYVRPADPAVRKLQRLRAKPELAEIVKTVLCELNENMPWSVGCRANDASRAITAYLARRRYGYSAKAVANALWIRLSQQCRPCDSSCRVRVSDVAANGQTARAKVEA